MEQLLYFCLAIFASAAGLSQEGKPGFKEQIVDQMQTARSTSSVLDGARRM